MSIYNIRIPVAKPGHRMKSKKDYTRIITAEDKDDDPCMWCEGYNCQGCPFESGIGNTENH